MAAVPPSPVQPRRRSFGSGVMVGLLIAILVAVVAVGVVLATRRTGSETAASLSSPASPSANPSPSPSASPQPPTMRAQITRRFSDQKWVKGERLWLEAGDFSPGHRDTSCLLHTYRPNGSKSLVAFETDCASWESNGYDIIIFYVALRNNTNHALSFNLRNFVLAARDSRTFGPVNVRSKATSPPNFLPVTAKVPPRSNIVGYLTFDGRVTRLVPARLSYIDGNQTLTVVFDGKLAVQG
jgi:hypothetical protein